MHVRNSSAGLEPQRLDPQSKPEGHRSVADHVGAACFAAPPVAAVVVVHGIVHAVAADLVGAEVLGAGGTVFAWGRRKLGKEREQ